MNTQLLYANSILLSSHLFMSSIPVNYLLSDSANKPTSNDEGASIVCLSNLFSSVSVRVWNTPKPFLGFMSGLYRFYK